MQLTPIAIIVQRIIKKNNKEVTKVLVHWQGIAQEDATWEQYHVLMKKYQHARLEDKVEDMGGGTWHVYIHDLNIGTGKSNYVRLWVVFIVG